MRAVNDLMAASGRLALPALDRLMRPFAGDAESGWSLTLPAHGSLFTDRPLILAAMSAHDVNDP